MLVKISKLWRWNGLQRYNFHTKFLSNWTIFSKVGTETQTLMDNMIISKAYIILRKKGKYVEGVVLIYSC